LIKFARRSNADDVFTFQLLYVNVALREDERPIGKKGELESKKSQMWHLLLWSVLSYKPAMTHYFVLHTAAPLGTTLMLSRRHLLCFAWVVDDAKCIVVTRVCVYVCSRPHAYTIAQTPM